MTMMPSHSPLAILAVKNLRRSRPHFLLGGDEQPGIGVQLHELTGKLFQQVVGDHEHRLLGEAGLLHLHRGTRPTKRR